MEYVLITGGTSGIGYELARIFTSNKFGVIIVSGNKDKLQKAKNNLEKEFNMDIRTIEQDLSKIGSAQKVYDQIIEMGIDISILINNAGVGVVGPIEEVSIHNEENMLNLNILAVVGLTKLFLVDMYKKKNGRILNVASTGAFQPGPFTSTYYASKSFVYSFSKAIRYEAKKMGVKVCVLCPGATKTEFFHRAGKGVPKSAMSAEKVASITYKKFMHNKEVIVPGALNNLLRVVPTKIRMKGIARFQMKLKRQMQM